MRSLHLSRRFVKTKWFIAPAAFLLGSLVILTIRYFAYAPEQVHYHANFALYINGQQELFKSPGYYQEVAVCSSTHNLTMPQQRTHMHDNTNSVIHVHDHVVTWDQFFQNIGWSIGTDFIETSGGQRYLADDQHKVHIMLDDQDYTDLPVMNRVIPDKARLLISYGDVSDAQLKKQYDSIPATAAKYDATTDPASCSGTHKITPGERLKHLFN